MRLLPTMVGVTAGVLVSPLIAAPICNMMGVTSSGDSIGLDDFVQAGIIVGILMLANAIL